jgi:UDP-3-O-[3-hydroxymyristoyl] glucosamine N-acyltransferase
MMGGQVGLADHVNVGSGAMLGAQSGHMSDVPPGARLMGSPAVPVREFMRTFTMLRKLARIGGNSEGDE